MNLNNLKSNQELLMSHMKKNGYSYWYISKINAGINKILKSAKDNESYLEYYNRIIKPHVKNNKRNHNLEILNIIMNFDLYGKLPNRTTVKHKIIDISNYSRLSEEFKNIIDTYIKVSSSTEKKLSTIHHEALNGASFLVYIQNNKIINIKDITENHVLSFFLNDNNELIYSCSYKKNIRAVFKACIPYIEGTERVMNYLPSLRENRKNIQFLKPNEIEAIKKVLDNDNSNISLRNKAIVSILLYTGLRSCDIFNLKLNNIDWQNEIIYIIQAKTDVPLELPLSPSVGNALYDYITNERPSVEISNVFIREDSNLPINKSSVDIAVNKVMNEANIRMNSGDRRGTHIFRYHLATFLLEKNISQPVISSMLGHTSPSSLEAYLKADTIHLENCALSIEPFERSVNA